MVPKSQSGSMKPRSKSKSKSRHTESDENNRREVGSTPVHVSETEELSSGKSENVVLVVERDRKLARKILDFLESKSLPAIVARCGGDALERLAEGTVDVVIIDDRLPDMSGYDLCSLIQRISSGTRVIFLSKRSAFDVAVLAMRVGACDYLTKPFEMESLNESVTRALRHVAQERKAGLERYKRSKEWNESVLLDLRGTFGSINDDVKRASAVEAPVLISGETGTGKTVAAQAIHYWGGNRRGAFVDINCASLPENLIEAELFGHERGAFTGAINMRKGVFEMSQKGTLFLDELCELPIHLQAKLLSALEEKKIRRIGATGEIRVDTRIIAATSHDPEEAVEIGGLRSDLYYRLCVMRIHIPPLRERPWDIPVLSGYLLEQITGDSTYHLAEDELERLMSYSWPGNIRELRNVLERAAILQPGPMLKPSRYLSGPRGSSRLTPIPAKLGELSREQIHFESSRHLTMKDIERRHIAYMLEVYSGNQTLAARTLDIGLSTLKRKIKAYGLAKR